MTAAARRGGKRVGYLRVSNLDQNPARQLDGVELNKRFEDKASGKDTNRPELHRCLEYLRDGDVLIVHSMDRLSRSLSDLLKLVDDLNKRGVAVEFVKEHLTFTGDDSPMSKLMLGVMGSCAEFERAMIRERQREGIAKAKADGRTWGRKAKLTAAQVSEIESRLSTSRVSVAELAREYGVSRQTLYSSVPFLKQAS